MADPAAHAIEPVPRAFEEDRSRETELLKLIGELRDVFENNFDRTWFSLILDGIPVDLRTVREIRELVSLTSIYAGEEWLIYQGVQELEKFHTTVKRFLLPVLKERLGISWLFPHKRVRDPQQYILRKFVAFTFPYNLERLRRLTLKLKSRLLFYFPSLS
jgi:hypothetical protein